VHAGTLLSRYPHRVSAPNKLKVTPRSSRGSSRARVKEILARIADQAFAGPKGRRGEHEEPRTRPLRELLRAFHVAVTGERGSIAIALVLTTMGSLLALLPPALTGIALDYAITDAPGPSGLPSWFPFARDRVTLLTVLAVLLVGAAVFDMITGFLAQWQLMRVSHRVNTRSRRRVFHHVVRLPLHRLEAMKSGGISSVLRSDAGSVGTLVSSLIFSPWGAFVRLVGTLVVLTAIHPVFLVGVVVFGLVTALSHRTWIGRIRPLWRASRERRASVDGHAAEVLSGIRVVRIFRREATALRHYLVENNVSVRLDVRAWWWQRGIEAIWDVATPALGAGVLLVGGLYVVRGDLTVGDLMMFTTYLIALMGPIEALVSIAARVQDGLAGLERTLDILEEPVEHAGQRGTRALVRDDVKGELALENVAFTYPGTEKPVFDDVTLRIAPGETVAFVGTSGAGKTTLTKLFARFYDPDRGRVLLDGQDVRELVLDDYRATLALVEQDVFLFDGTVGENIRFAHPDASDDAVAGAARAAFADGFIAALPKGYDTLIGERGVKLSGGQRQRIAIARAILADPRVLILDEATSSLDVESERAIQTSLEALRKGRTSIIIAHRLSTVRNADRVVVIEQGRIVEQGTHDALLLRGARYAELVAAQVGEPVEQVRATAN
jgi:ATP-binding cassette subfamily B protein